MEMANIEAGKALKTEVKRGDPLANRDQGKAIAGQQSGLSPLRPDIVDGVVQFSSPEDLDDPKNWSSSRKWMAVASASVLTWIVPVSSTIIGPAAPTILNSFSSDSSILSTFVITVLVLGYAIGPLVLSPLSEIYGRLPVYHTCSVLFLVFSIGCAAAQNLAMLIGFRFLTGAAGSFVFTPIPGTIADLFVQRERGLPVSVWALGLTVGPTVGPICGGFMTNTVGWRWEFWVMAIASGVAVIVQALGLRETFPPVLLEWKAARLRKSTGDDSFRSALHVERSPFQALRTTITRPAIIARQPIVTLLSLYGAFVYSLLYFFITDVLSEFSGAYGFSLGLSGLAYIGFGVGMLIMLLANAVWSDKSLQHQAAKRGDGRVQPEDRLLPLLTLAPTIPAGLLIYGWAAQYHVLWVVPVLGEAVAGVGILMVFIFIPSYLIDAFPLYAASADTVLAVLRSVITGFLPLAGPSLYGHLGQGWANSLLAFITLAFIPAPWLFYKFGAQIRQNPRFKVHGGNEDV